MKTVLVIHSIFFFLFSQSKNLSYKSLSVSDGLADPYIYDLMEDHNAFIWLGTQDGLNRYDGSEFTHFSFQPKNKNSLSDIFVYTLLEDRQHIIWVGTTNGLNRFNPSKNEFTRFFHKPLDSNSLSHDVVRSIYEDRFKDRLLIGTLAGLDQFFPKENRFIHLWPQKGEKSSFEDAVHSIAQAKDSLLFFGTNGKGLFVYDNKRITAVMENVLGNLKIRDLKIQENTLLISSKRDLFYSLNLRNKQLEELKLSNKINAPANTKKTIQVSDSSIYLLTNTGLEAIALKNKKRSTIFSSDIINDFVKTKNDLIFLATENGLKIVDTRRNAFFSYRNSDYPVRSFLETNPHRLWVAVDKLGIDIWNLKKKGDDKIIRRFWERDLSSTEIKCIYQDSKKQIWIGTEHGLNLFEPKTNKFKKFYAEKNGLSHSLVWSITEGKDKKLWIGTYYGLTSYNLESKRFKRFVIDNGGADENDIRSLLVDRENTLWLGTWNGLFKIQNQKFKELSHYTKENSELSYNSISSLTQDSLGHIWIGTFGGGFNIFDPKSKRFQSYTKQDGLANNVIYSSLFSADSEAWLSSNKALSRIDFSPNMKVKNYTKEDGLHGNQMSFNAFHKGKSGRFYFGGLEGFTYFYPKDIEDQKHSIRLFFTEFKLLNKAVPIKNKYTKTNKEDFYLDEALSENSVIKLKHWQNSFSISFKALSFRSTTNINYAHQLVDFEEDWVYTGKKHSVDYTNVPAGNYTFRARSSNAEGLWKNNSIHVEIKIEEAWWNSILFRVFILILLLSIFYLIHYYRLRQVQKIEAIKQTIASDLHDDLASNLNSIVLYSSALSNARLEASDRTRIQKDLNRVATDSVLAVRHIIQTMKSKSESYDIFFKRFISYTRTLSLAKNIVLSVEYDSRNSFFQRKISFKDKRNLLFLLKEILNNALRHSKTKQIDFSIRDEKLFLVIELRDYGTGFELNSPHQGSGLKNVRQRAKNLNALLEIESVEEKGSLIKIKIPKRE